MRLKQNRSSGQGVLALAIRALCVLAITLVAMGSPHTSSASVPNCENCPETAPSLCEPECAAENPCPKPKAVPTRCQHCYWSVCTEWECPVDDGGPDNGTRVDCVMSAQDGVPWG